METYKLSDAEEYIMQRLWQYGAMTSSAISRHVSNKSWNRSTLNTFLKRLTVKEMIQVEKIGKTNLYIPLVTKETYQVMLGNKFLQEIYDGCAKDFMVSMVTNNCLSDKDIKELRDWFIEQGGTIDE